MSDTTPTGTGANTESASARTPASLPVLHRQDRQPADDEFSELIYDDEALPAVAALYPEAYYMDASDMIHDGRFAVILPRAERDNFYVSMILNGWVRSCLGFELSMRMHDRQDEVRRWLDAAQARKAAS